MLEQLNFNACLTLLVIAFIFGLITVRCLLAVVNRAFLVVDYAHEKFFDKKGGKGGSSFGMKDLFGMGLEMAKPYLQKGMKDFFGGGKPK